jgi:hypothetical protein
MSAVIAFLVANKALIATIAFAISEALGANPKVKSNGILSLILLQAQAALKKEGAKDLTP